jgi:hypothetical protein
VTTPIVLYYEHATRSIAEFPARKADEWPCRGMAVDEAAARLADGQPAIVAADDVQAVRQAVAAIVGAM